jgi:hypothetical protein
VCSCTQAIRKVSLRNQEFDEPVANGLSIDIVVFGKACFPVSTTEHIFRHLPGSVVMDTSSDFFLAQLPLFHTFVRHHFVVTDLHPSKFFAEMSQEIRRCLPIGILVSLSWSLNPSNSFLLLLVPFPVAGVFEPDEASEVCM